VFAVCCSVFAVCCSVHSRQNANPAAKVCAICGMALIREGVTHTLCCSVLQCVAVCCSVLQCVAVCCSVPRRWVISVCLGLRCNAVGLQCAAVWCSVWQCVALCQEGEYDLYVWV